eukprot:2765392-Amphidinium_carterae.1
MTASLSSRPHNEKRHIHECMHMVARSRAQPVSSSYTVTRLSFVFVVIFTMVEWQTGVAL